MIFKCCAVLLLLNCVRTNKSEEFYDGLNTDTTELGDIYSYWPSTLNAARIMQIRKRQIEKEQPAIGNSEGGNVVQPSVVSETQNMNPEKITSAKQTSDNSTGELPAGTDTSKNSTIESSSPVHNTSVSSSNITLVNATESVVQSKVDWKDPGVVKRGAIVFGGFALLSAAYFIFYRMKGKKTDSASTHGLNDASQVRYGILNSEDSRDKMELSRMPLTMESDDDDEYLEIFDMEQPQRNKSLSYVNLERPDEDIVLSVSTDNINEDRNNLLLDIEDRGSDTLIDWSNNSDKFIL